MKFIEADRDQLFLLPPSVDEWLPAGHLARFICAAVATLDLRRFRRLYRRHCKGGAPAYGPKMMLSLLFYAYCQGMSSSRQIERASYEDVAVRFICGNRHPDHDTICNFRSKHRGSIGELFVQLLRLCREAGMIKGNDVGVDGTKILASASGQQTMNHERLSKAEARLRAEVEELLRKAAEVDAAEDAQFGKGKRGDEAPAGMETAEGRLAAILAAKARLEEQAREEAEAEQSAARRRAEDREAEEKSTGKKKRGRAPEVKPFDELYASRLAQLQVNVTDPDSQLMQDGATKAIVQAYNCQTVVDAHCQIIVAASVTTEANDKRQLVPMLEEATANLGEAPVRAVADAGYFSAAAVTHSKLAAIDLYVSPSRDKGDETDEAQDVTQPEVREGEFIKYTVPPRPKAWPDRSPMRCGPNSEPKKGNSFTVLAGRSWRDRSAKSRKAEGSDDLVCEVKRRRTPSGSWFA